MYCKMHSKEHATQMQSTLCKMHVRLVKIISLCSSTKLQMLLMLSQLSFHVCLYLLTTTMNWISWEPAFYYDASECKCRAKQVTHIHTVQLKSLKGFTWMWIYSFVHFRLLLVSVQIQVMWNCLTMFNGSNCEIIFWQIIIIFPTD